MTMHLFSIPYEEGKNCLNMLGYRIWSLDFAILHIFYILARKNN